MTGITLFDGFSHGLERVLDLRREQQLLIGANLANADTPGYRAREIPFAEVLTNVMEAAERGESIPEAEVVTREPPPGALDGNSVSAEEEAVKLTSNVVMYNALATGVSRRLAMLRYAASDGRS